MGDYSLWGSHLPARLAVEKFRAVTRLSGTFPGVWNRTSLKVAGKHLGYSYLVSSS
jgi:hypothetical protein